MKPIIILFAASFMIISCDKEKTDLDKIDSYPIGIGSEWLYDYSGKFYTASGEEKKLHSEIRVKIEKDTVLNDTMNVLIFRAYDSYSEHISTEYLFMDSEGLKNYAYENPGRNVFARNLPDNVLLHQAFNPSIKKKSTIGDDIFYEAIPRLHIPFPLNADSKWTYLHATERLDWQIDKEAIGKERISLNGNDYNCLKIKWIYVKSCLSSPPEITDWISKEGLVKRLTLIKNGTLVDEYGQEIGNADMTEELVVKEIRLKN